MTFKPTDWLGPLIEEDTRAAVAWFQRTVSSTQVKKDPTCKFDNDGSNILSELESSQLSGSNAVQIVKVLSADDPLLLISDGFTSVRARLSIAAVATLEAEIGEAISLDVKGDVFAIERCTIVSTPYGPPSEQVQLSIDGIKYLYHLRRVVNVSTFAGERPETSRLMMEVIRMRQPEQDSLDPKTRTNGSAKETQSSERFATQAVLQSPKSQADVDLRSSPPAILSKNQPIQRSKVASARHRKAPNMARDGVEMTAGVNLARPTAAIPNRQAQHSAGATVSSNKAHLLSVLGSKRKASDEGQTRDLAAEYPASAVSPPAARSHQSPVDAASPLASAGKSSYREKTPGSMRSEPVDTVVPRSAQSINRSASGRPSSKQSARARALWQRGIPKDQQRLLDAATSWLPPLPGRQFPHPNVPMELLKQWNEQALKRPESVTLSQSQPRSSAIVVEDDREEQGSASSSSEDATGKDSDEEIPGWSSSPASHMQPAAAAIENLSTRNNSPARPPSGSASSPLSSSPPERLSGPGTPVGRRSDLPPDSSFEHPVAPRALASKNTSRTETKTHRNAGPALLAERRKLTPQQSPQPMSERRLDDGYRPTDLASPKGMFASRSTQQDSSSGDRRGRLTSPASNALGQTGEKRPKAWTEPPRQQHNSAAHKTPNPTQSTPKGDRSKTVTTTPDVEILHVRQSPAQLRPRAAAVVPPSTAATVVKGTQMQAEGDDDVMEIEPPPRVDPLLEHKQRRSEHFRKEQRRKWIRANYTPQPKKPFSLGALYSGYKKAYPRDELRPSQLADALAEEFPHASAAVTKDNTPPTLPNGSALTSGQVSPSAQRAPASRADLDAADPALAKVASRAEPSQQQQPKVGLVSTAVKRAKDGLSNSQPPEMPSRMAHGSSPPLDRATGTNIAASKPSTNGTVSPAAGKVAEASSMARKAIARSTEPSPVGSALPASTKGKNEPDHRAWLIKRIGAEQQRLREARGDARETGNGEAFREFADTWRACGPGGAFAKRDGSGKETEGGQRKRLRVLEWGL